MKLLDIKPDKKLIEELKDYFRQRPHIHPNISHEMVKRFIARKSKKTTIIIKKDGSDIDQYIDFIYDEYLNSRKGEVFYITTIDKKKHAKGRTPAEREKRRIDDFKKNTMPTLPKRERQYFEQKYGRV